MPDILAMYAGAFADKPAIIDDHPGGPVRSWSFAELNRWSNQLARLLMELGITDGTKIVSCGQNSAALLAMTHAARKTAAVLVPLNYRLTPDEAAYVIDNSDATAIYVDAEFTGLIDAVRDRTPKIRDVLVFDGDGELERRLQKLSDSEPDVEPEGPVGTAMIYTSGTTGKPKGAVRSRTDPAATAALIGLIGYETDDIYITTGPLYHSGPGGFAAVAHALGNTIVVQRKFDPEDWLRLVDTHKVTTTFSAPTPIRMVCSVPDDMKKGYDRSTMKRMIANAAPWSFTLKKMYMADFPADSLWEVYGSTELGVDTVLAPDDQLRKPGSCGKPAPMVDIVLFDEQGKEVTEPFAHGELFVRSANVFETYHKDSEKYNADRRGDFHTVGDIAYRDEEGYYYIADRKKDMIITGGMNVYPAEVEAALEQNPGIFDVAVFAVPNDEWGEEVHAVVVRAPGYAALTGDQVMAFAREHLAGYKIPRSVSFLDELPRTGSGKVLKRELRAPFWSDPKA
jgi:fatty-acyl-CoA synthase/long-chain acyl-CoA synthetase